MNRANKVPATDCPANCGISPPGSIRVHMVENRQRISAISRSSNDTDLARSGGQISSGSQNQIGKNHRTRVITEIILFVLPLLMFGLTGSFFTVCAVADHLAEQVAPFYAGIMFLLTAINLYQEHR